MILFVIFIALLNVYLFIKIKETTIPFIVLVNALFLPLGFLDWFIFAVVIAGIVILVSYKFYLIREEKDVLSFDHKIASVQGVVNQLTPNPVDLVSVGRILPTHPKELKYNRKMISVDNRILSSGLLVSGSTGSGKTTTLLSIIRQKLEQGYPILFVDYKGDLEIVENLEQIAKQLGIDFFEYSSRGCNFKYDPFKNLNETGKVESLMNTRQWSANGADAHYKSSTQLVIQNVIRQYEKVHKEEDNYLVGLYQFALGYKADSQEREGHYTLLKQLEIILTSKASEMFTGDEKTFTFERETPFIIVFSFVSANKSLANALSSFIFQDVLDRAIRKPFTRNLLISVDEFGTIESPTLIKDLVEKGRSGGCQTILSILDLNQLAITTNEHFVQALLGTIDNFIIFAGATQKTAELLAGVQKYEGRDFSIMSLRKPYNRKPPTALFISKFPLVRKKGNQDTFRIEPYSHKVKTKIEVLPDIVEIKEDTEIVTENTTVENQENIIDNIDEFL